MRSSGIGLALAALLACALGWAATRPVPPRLVRLTGYATPLSGRTPAQRWNAAKAAAAIDGAVIPPGGVFSYNRRVGSWSRGSGYRRAPVSYGGQIVLAYGGGVCQTSSALYNAALLAGLEIAERHPHTAAPRYVPPGRDAAVAFPGIDLRLRNPYPGPVRIEARVRREALEVDLYGAQRPNASFVLRTDVLFHDPPAGRLSGPRRRLRGICGGRVVTWRLVSRDGQEVRRERLGDDTYLAFEPQ